MRCRAATFAAVLAACATSAAAEPEWTIRMTAEPAFAPKQVIVEEGESVRWTNTSDQRFTVTADPSRAPAAEYVRVPPQGQAFHSGPIGPGETFERTFPAPGTFIYFSEPHVENRVVGTVTVERLDAHGEPHQYGEGS